ncbi:hypothetical protein SCHPADRAFT_211966 [Schizopora paradoxa]|uniref:Uncharacterized protein n=1 Tax=Schizopora paradoxa TaxID=27342 RepID=A0A0H2S4C7_9AGAM|nr:hypothetical protein SCHPADRAFT_211966 [Schizopora paradoxa]
MLYGWLRMMASVCPPLPLLQSSPQQCIDRSLMMRVGPDPGTSFGTRTVDAQYKRAIGSGGRGLENIMNCDGDECTPHPREPSFVFLLVRFPWDNYYFVCRRLCIQLHLPFLLSLLMTACFMKFFSLSSFF